MTRSRGIRRKRGLPPDCHPELKHHALGLCLRCYLATQRPNRAAATRRRAVKNPERVRATRRKSMAVFYKKRRALLHAIKSKPCMDCGKKFHPSAMEFDHRDPTTKSHGIARWTSLGWASVLSEMEKCDLVCANCHRVRTWNRNNPEDLAA